MSGNHPRHGDHGRTPYARLGLRCVRGGRPEIDPPRGELSDSLTRRRYKRIQEGRTPPLFGASSESGQHHQLLGSDSVHQLPGTVPLCLPELRSVDVLYPLMPPTPRHGPAGQAPFRTRTERAPPPLGIKTPRAPLGMTGVLSARSGRQEVAIFRGTGFGSAPRRWGRHIGVCDAGPTVSALQAAPLNDPLTGTCRKAGPS